MLPDWLSDVQIQFAPISENLIDAGARGVLWQAAPGRFLLHAPEVARYLVENGQRITIESLGEVDRAVMRRFLYMAPLAALLYLRGRLAFHAGSAVPVNDRDQGALIFPGDSGAGKSTLLAALHHRGWHIAADDLAAIDDVATGQLVVRPTYQEVMLWEDAVEKLKIPGLAADLSAEVQNDGRRIVTYPVQEAEISHGLHILRGIIWLTVHSGPDIELEKVAGAKAFRAVGTMIYNSHIADALLHRGVYMGQAGAIAQTIPIYRLRRPRGEWRVEEMADKVEELVGRNFSAL